MIPSHLECGHHTYMESSLQGRGVYYKFKKLTFTRRHAAPALHSRPMLPGISGQVLLPTQSKRLFRIMVMVRRRKPKETEVPQGPIDNLYKCSTQMCPMTLNRIPKTQITYMVNSQLITDTTTIGTIFLFVFPRLSIPAPSVTGPPACYVLLAFSSVALDTHTQYPALRVWPLH